ncbi:DUF6894 family protein [Methylobacterium soli]|uniref:Catalase n=1 Tax=Methylobacterium soli TaxID=553447 RepID=A0A6L3SU01_9HYPH|nr:catalase [Methylobacterium soli]KAB1077089.1 catalase [Methylobacterium soli]GJE45004.1 hypothetical protein AEGHOMDF_4198 [Methylobacterium soli]
MARFFFNIRLDDAYLPERTGQCVEGPEAARAVARTIIRALVAQHGGEPRLLNAAIVVTDEAGDTVFALSFFEAIYVPVAPAVPVRTVGAPEARGRPTPAIAARTRLAALRTPLSGLRLRLAGRRRPWQACWAEGVLRLREAFGRPPFAVPGR